MYRGDIAPLIGIFIVALSVVSIVVTRNLKDYFLKKEQIKADAMIKAEEIKARNQLELEKLMRREDIRSESSNISNNLNYSDNERTIREKA